MLAFKKYIQRPLLLFCILFLVISVVFFPAFAADYNNGFFDYQDYSTLNYDSSTGNIEVTCKFPDSLYNTRLYYGNKEVHFNGPVINTGIISNSTFRLVINPFNGSMNTGPSIGGTNSTPVGLSLATIPRNTILNFSITMYLENPDFNELGSFSCQCVFMNDNGVYVFKTYASVTDDVIDTGNGIYRIVYDISLNLGALSLPSDASGLDFRFNSNYKLLGTSNASSTINLSPLRLVFNIEDKEYNFLNQQIDSERIANIDKQLGDLITGTPEQNEAVNGAVDQMQQAGDDLKDLGSSMSNVPKPDPGDINVSIDQFVSPGTMLAYTQPFLSLWENPTMLSMLIIVLTLVLVSWVMFGKKGG